MEKSTGSSRRRLSQSPTRSHGLFHMYNCNISIHVSLRRRTDFLASILLGTGISIHVSLRRRRTPGRDLIKARYTISTHISARERTPSFKCSLNALSVLQLTSPQGDVRNVKVLIHNSGISTHVSARRRTKHTMNCSRVLIFQFMSPQGDEHKAVSLFISLLLFQLTSP